MKFIDLEGKKFDRLTVVSYAGKTNRGQSKWECVCDCGTVKTIQGYLMTSGASRSCGCLRKEITKKRETKHEKSKTLTYSAWCSIKTRCTNPKSQYWNTYGGRGITICDRWLHSFENFLLDMGEIPFGGAQIDRIDNDVNYSPDNCRWVTNKENQRNKSNNHLITYNGETLTLAEWSDRTGVPYKTLHNRINNCKWEIGKAITEKVSTGRGDDVSRKIKSTDIVTIKERYGNGESQKSIAMGYGVDASLISRIVNNKTWKQIGGIYQ